MRDIVVIDGARGAGVTEVAGEVARRLDRPLARDGMQFPEGEQVVIEGGAILAQYPDARWKFYLAADPRVRLQRLSELDTLEKLVQEERVSLAGKSGRLPDGAVLIDITDYTVEQVAEIITTLIQAELE